MASFNIPALGETLCLNHPWRFELFGEVRNKSLINIVNPAFNKLSYQVCNKIQDLVMPAGTVLIVDRIYLRQRKGKWNSVTFQVASCPNKDWEGTRFWVKLSDANKIEYTPGVKVTLKPFFGKKGKACR